MIALLLLAATGTSSQTLGLDQAIRLALERQPTLRQASASVDAAKARVRQAASGLWPQVRADLSYQRATGNFSARPGSVPSAIAASSGTSFNTSSYFTFGASATELVWDFGGTTGRWHAAEASQAAEAANADATRLGVILQVRSDFFAARAQKELVRVGKETLANQDHHLEQIKGFVEVGTRPQIDLAQARTDRANAEVALIQAENGYAVARAQLNQAIGLEATSDYDVSDDSIPEIAEEGLELEQLVKVAVAARPELAKLREQARSDQFTVDAEKGAYFPNIAVSTGLTDNGPALDSLVWNWNAQLQVGWQIFSGWQTDAKVAEARANLAVLDAQTDSERQAVRLEVEQARLAVRGARAELAAAGDALTNAQERLRLAEGRYETGVGSVIELGDAQVALTNASAQQVRAQFNLATARAQLLKALGRP